MKNNKDIINYEIMGGWPVYKMSLREILMKICEERDGELVIAKDNPLLDTYPLILEVDCMGYGINGRRVCEVFAQSEEGILNIFTEEELPNIELWRKSEYGPYERLYNKDLGKEVDLKDIRENNGELEYLCYDVMTKNEYGWFNKRQLSRN